MAKYRRTFSSGGKQTSTANQVVDFIVNETNHNFNYSVQYLNFQTFATPCNIKLNGESTIHWIDANSEIIFEDITIDKFTIIDSGVEYYYTAMSME